MRLVQRAARVGRSDRDAAAAILHAWLLYHWGSGSHNDNVKVTIMDLWKTRRDAVHPWRGAPS